MSAAFLPTLNRHDAMAQHYKPLAGPYTEGERWMLDNVIADLRAGNREFVLVPESKTETCIYTR